MHKYLEQATACLVELNVPIPFIHAVGAPRVQDWDKEEGGETQKGKLDGGWGNKQKANFTYFSFASCDT